MKREDLEEWLNTKWLGRNLQMMEETDSTNQRAKTGGACDCGRAADEWSGQEGTWLDFPSGRKYLYDDAPASCI